jgi:predicted phosphoribosyltransferase
MTAPEEISELRQHLAKVQGERDAWRAAGNQDRYMEAYFMAQALELQLDILVHQALGSPPQPSLWDRSNR